MLQTVEDRHCYCQQWRQQLSLHLPGGINTRISTNSFPWVVAGDKMLIWFKYFCHVVHFSITSDRINTISLEASFTRGGIAMFLLRPEAVNRLNLYTYTNIFWGLFLYILYPQENTLQLIFHILLLNTRIYYYYIFRKKKGSIYLSYGVQSRVFRWKCTGVSELYFASFFTVEISAKQESITKQLLWLLFRNVG
jgi:hypothetical protein